MNAYTINQQLDSLYKDLEAAHNNDERTVCLMFNADSKKEVIQFWNDDLYDYYGNYSRLASDIARELFNPSEIQYCISAE